MEKKSERLIVNTPAEHIESNRESDRRLIRNILKKRHDVLVRLR